MVHLIVVKKEDGDVFSEGLDVGGVIPNVVKSHEGAEEAGSGRVDEGVCKELDEFRRKAVFGNHFPCDLRCETKHEGGEGHVLLGAASDVLTGGGDFNPVNIEDGLDGAYKEVGSCVALG